MIIIITLIITVIYTEMPKKPLTVSVCASLESQQ